MAERKTIDVYQLHVNYGQGWEYEIAEFTRHAARKRKKEYSRNCPEYDTKIVKKREPKSDYSDDELERIERQIQHDMRQQREDRKQRREHNTR